MGGQYSSLPVFSLLCTRDTLVSRADFFVNLISALTFWSSCTHHTNLKKYGLFLRSQEETNSSNNTPYGNDFTFLKARGISILSGRAGNANSFSHSHLIC